MLVELIDRCYLTLFSAVTDGFSKATTPASSITSLKKSLLLKIDWSVQVLNLKKNLIKNKEALFLRKTNDFFSFSIFWLVNKKINYE